MEWCGSLRRAARVPRRAWLPRCSAGVHLRRCASSSPSCRRAPSRRSIFAADGTPIVTLHAEENRTDVTLGEIPTHVRDAVIAIEDERFWLPPRRRPPGHPAGRPRQRQRGRGRPGRLDHHPAAGEAAAARRRADPRPQGPGGGPRLAARGPLHEGADPRALPEHDLLRQRRLRRRGGRATSTSASRPAELTVAEGALLAGLIRAPSANDPYDEPEAAVERRDLVLDAMLDQDLHRPRPTDAAVRRAPRPRARRARARGALPRRRTSSRRSSSGSSTTPASATPPQERRELLFAGGLRVHTTIDLGLQAPAEAAVAAVLPDPDRPRRRARRHRPGHRPRAGHGRRPRLLRRRRAGEVQPGHGPGPPHRLVVQAPRARRRPRRTACPLTEQSPRPASIPLPCRRTPSLGRRQLRRGRPGVPVDLAEATVRSYNTVYAQLILRVGAERAIEMAPRLWASPARSTTVPLGRARRQRRAAPSRWRRPTPPSPTAASTSTRCSSPASSGPTARSSTRPSTTSSGCSTPTSPTG